MDEDEDLQARFEQAVEAALREQGLADGVSVFLMPGRSEDVVEIEDFSATPMRQGLGTRGMEIMVRLADDIGVTLRLRVANDGDDGVLRGADDPDRPPSEGELIDWYARFGFDAVGGIDETVMVRRPQPNPAAAPRR